MSHNIMGKKEKFFPLTILLSQEIIIAFANSIDPDETAQWAVPSGSTLFDIQSFNFTYECLSKR